LNYTVGLNQATSNSRTTTVGLGLTPRKPLRFAIGGIRLIIGWIWPLHGTQAFCSRRARCVRLCSLTSLTLSKGTSSKKSSPHTNGYQRTFSRAIGYTYLVAFMPRNSLTKSHNCAGFSRGAYQARVLAGMIKVVSVSPWRTEILKQAIIIQVGLLKKGNIRQSRL
jgi:hypothetical protein